MSVRRIAAALVLAATALTVIAFAARGGGEKKPDPRPVAVASVAPPTTADVAYAQMMVAHHAQAVRMSRALIAKPGVPERIRLIAEFIVHDQQREINETNAWLDAWGEQAGGHDHAHGAGAASQGMLTDAQLHELDIAKTDQAVPLFLRRMIEHHRGAVVSSRALLDGDGRNVYIHGLAKHVINEQTAEIDAMAALLPASPGRKVSGAAAG
ncbi:DUF305 domain-containing protein [Actinoplanes sp. NPDC049681]|uniref:DUF305 domain-containing protein n=1 Tax=Actinoplanes sp. NPDC049681 TaxID=3363905 RepID=UPI0037911BBB